MGHVYGSHNPWFFFLPATNLPFQHGMIQMQAVRRHSQTLTPVVCGVPPTPNLRDFWSRKARFLSRLLTQACNATYYGGSRIGEGQPGQLW